MFQRLNLGDTAAPFVIVAFVAAATIFISITWRAWRMPRGQVERLAQLPFTKDSSDERP